MKSISWVHRGIGVRGRARVSKFAELMGSSRRTRRFKASCVILAIITALISGPVAARSRPKRPPGKRRSPTPSWPWNIKTSLIVLWGVCWMFYPFPASCDVENFFVEVEWSSLGSRWIENGKAFSGFVSLPRDSLHS